MTRVALLWHMHQPYYEDLVTREHIMPFGQQGQDSWMNVVTACRACNQRKGNRTPEEAAMPLRTRPRAPTFGVYAHGQFAHWQPQWTRYLGG